MKKSLFQFTNPHIDEIIFKVNTENYDKEMPIEISVEPYINDEIENTGNVSLRLLVGRINDDAELLTPVYFSGVISAEFKWDSSVKDVENMLKINGGTVLLSYIRPVLSSLTMQAGIKPIHIPFINFAENYLD